MKKLIIFSILAFSGWAQAKQTKVVSFEYYPFLGNLGWLATPVEMAMSDEFKAFCGSLENVEEVRDIHLEMKSRSVSKLNPTGKAGDVVMYQSIFTFAYPLMTGEATVTCKE